MEPGAYADTLRALGRFLDMVRATEISVTEREDQLRVLWVGYGGRREERLFDAEDLAALRRAARFYRGLEGRTPRFNASELLRTIGAIVDELGATELAVTESVNGFEITG